MKRWPIKPLGEVVEFVRGISFKPTDLVEAGTANSLACFRTKNVQALLEADDLLHIPRSFVRNDRQLVQEGDALISAANSNNLVGKCCFVPRLDYPATLGGFIAAIRADPTYLKPRFLYYWLASPLTQKRLRGLSRQTTNISNLPLTDVAKEPISLPTLAEQERIVNLLDEADELRKLRAQADRRAAALIPALFYEMFGDPATNPFGWTVESVGNLFDRARGGAKCGPFGSALKKHEYVEVGVPVWGIPNVLPNKFVEAGSLFISPQKFDELRAYVVEQGDLLFSRAGTVGRICVATPTSTNSIMGTNLIRLALDQTKVIPDFVSALLTYFAKDVGRLRANIDKGAYSFMNTTVLKSLRIYVPPLLMQQEFAQRVTEIREFEAGQATSRTRLDALFQSMLHRAFNGDI